jgi:hypothetical protein
MMGEGLKEGCIEETEDKNQKTQEGETGADDAEECEGEIDQEYRERMTKSEEILREEAEGVAVKARGPVENYVVQLMIGVDVERVRFQGRRPSGWRCTRKTQNKCKVARVKQKTD